MLLNGFHLSGHLPGMKLDRSRRHPLTDANAQSFWGRDMLSEPDGEAINESQSRQIASREMNPCVARVLCRFGLPQYRA